MDCNHEPVELCPHLAMLLGDILLARLEEALLLEGHVGIEFVVHSLEGPILRRLANVNYNVSIVLPCFLMRHVSGAVTNHQALRMQATRDMHGKHYNTQMQDTEG